MMNKYKSLTVVENRLEELYDQGLQNTDEYAELEVLAERLADAETNRQDKMKQALERERQRVEAIREAIANEDMDLVQVLGETEFGDDYEICVEGTDHVIYSKVAKDEQSRWVLSNAEEAEKKQRQLYYYRLYDKYVRTGDADKVGNLEVR